MQEHEADEHPAHEVMEGIASKVTSIEEVRSGFPALWAHLKECQECMDAFAQLLQVAHEQGHREGHAEEEKSRRIVLLTAVASILVITLLASGFVFWQRRADEAIVNRVYQRMGPAVANIQVTSSNVTGSGVVFDRNGYVLTNYHVIRDAQDDQDIIILLPGLGEVSSKLVGFDVATDLAVLEVVGVPLDRLTVANFGDSSRVRVGDLAIAIGNPFGLSHSVTVGHISAVGRQLMTNDMYAPDIADVLQTDAPINPGNSGGPLFNSDGQVIGINTAIKSPSGGSVGIGFAISSNTARRVAREIIAQGYVRRPFLGAGGKSIDAALARDLGLPVDHGLLVQEIHPDSPAAWIGLYAGDGPVPTTSGEVKQGADIILSLDGEPVKSQPELNRLVAEHEIGDTVQLEILRNGQPMTFEVTLTERPMQLSSR